MTSIRCQHVCCCQTSGKHAKLATQSIAAQSPGAQAPAPSQSLLFAGAPLLMFCVLPDWRDCAGIMQLLQSRFVLGQRILEGGRHAYRSGFIHRCSDKHLRARFEGRTLLLWLGSDALREGGAVSIDEMDAQVGCWSVAGK